MGRGAFVAPLRFHKVKELPVVTDQTMSLAGR